MKFINNGIDKKVRSGETGNYSWATVKTGDSIDLPLEVGQAYGFTFIEDEIEDKPKAKPKTTKGKAGTKSVETKQEETNSEDSESENESKE